MESQITPSHIMQVGMGFWASKTLLTAVKLELFTRLNGAPLTARELGNQLGLHERGTTDFFDALVSLGLLGREGNGENARYTNTPETALFLDKDKPQYIGGVLEMANDRLYPFWGDLEHGLKTGEPQNEIKHVGDNFFESLYADPDRLRQFMGAMSGVQMGNFIALAEKFEFSRYRTMCDIGGASGLLSIQVAKRHPQMKCFSFDLPQVLPIARETIENSGLGDRVTAVSGNFFEDDFPAADVITMGNILHDWNLENKKLLMKKAYDALPEGGSLIAIENIIDNERRKNTFGLLMSLNMLIEVGDGFDFTGADFDRWAKEIGFEETTILPLTGPASAAITVK
ncbi:MAG: methyltransferase [Calditrichia bacterium]